jgi:hypothetical protein
MHPDQETLAAMMREAGFVNVGFNNLLGGSAAIHFGEAPLPTSAKSTPAPSALDTAAR